MLTCECAFPSVGGGADACLRGRRASRRCAAGGCEGLREYSARISWRRRSERFLRRSGVSGPCARQARETFCDLISSFPTKPSNLSLFAPPLSAHGWPPRPEPKPHGRPARAHGLHGPRHHDSEPAQRHGHHGAPNLSIVADGKLDKGAVDNFDSPRRLKRDWGSPRGSTIGSPRAVVPGEARLGGRRGQAAAAAAGLGLAARRVEQARVADAPPPRAPPPEAPGERAARRLRGGGPGPRGRRAGRAAAEGDAAGGAQGAGGRPRQVRLRRRLRLEVVLHEHGRRPAEEAARRARPRRQLRHGPP